MGALSSIWRNQLGQRSTRVALLVVVAALLFLAALVGLSYVAGFGAVRARLDHPAWPWLLAVVGAEALAFGGYLAAYRGLDDFSGGSDLDARGQLAVVSAGFGGFFARGGAAADQYVLEASGADKRAAKVRVFGLQALEHAPLAPIACGAAIFLLVAGANGHPPLDFLWPWAVAPAIGGLLAFWLSARFREPWRESDGWRGKVSLGLDAIWLLGELARGPEQPRKRALAFGGMSLYWAADIFALWAALAAFGFHMHPAKLVIGYTVGYAITRRSAPFGGAGLLDLFLPLTLWDSSAPLAAAVLGTCAYRIANLWLPMPFALASLPRLRAMSAESEEHALKEETGGGSSRRPLRVLERSPSEIALYTVLAASLSLGAITAVSWVAGFDAVLTRLEHPDWIWLVLALAGLVVSYPGYVLAFRESARAGAADAVELTAAAALVASGFGLFAVRGGFAADIQALEHAGVGVRDARLRVLGLGALEYVVLAPATCGAACVLIVTHSSVPLAFTAPWAGAVPLGFLFAVWAYRRREKLSGDRGWRRYARDAFDSLDCLLVIARKPALAAAAFMGMTLYWLGDAFMLWAVLRAFLGHAPSVPVLLVGYATGYALTRRTLPLAGAGVVAALLPFALHWVQFPFAAAVLAVFFYRIYNAWLPLVPALIGTAHLRRRLTHRRDLELGAVRG
jgi:uncharacterized membrane protein YbhN (UPF0104 family)